MDETLARGWGDVRAAMKRTGITPTASYVSALQTNPTGGTHEVWPYAGILSFSASSDLEELAGLTGLSAYVGATWGTGGNLAGSIDSTIPSSTVYAPSFFLGEMYVQESIKGGKLDVLAGRLAAGNGFANLPVFGDYVSYGINPNPFALGANDQTFLGPPPGAQWGAQATLFILRVVQLDAGVFNTNPNAADGANHGADFALQERYKGVLAAAQLVFQRNQDSNSPGKPGQAAVGFLNSNAAFPDLSNPQQHSDGYRSVYVMAQQMVFRSGPAGSAQGATLWTNVSLSTHDRVVPIPLFVSGGAVYQGLFPRRRNDLLCLGAMHGWGSKFGPRSNTATQVELNYQWVHSRYLSITPHWQYEFQDQSPPYRNTTTAGVQISLTL